MRYLDHWGPRLILPAVALLALPFMDPGSWVKLGVAGLAMGMMLFLMASGLTLIFGLMDVLNFAHGAFITIGAYVAVTVVAALGGWSDAPSWGLNLAVLILALLAGGIASGGVGWVFERVIVRGVYGSHLRQILITMGGLIIAEQLVIVLWSPQPLGIAKPASLRGSVFLGDIGIERYRLAAVAIGLLVWAAMHLLLNRTRIGLLVRAGVENREMVEALGYRIRRLFILVFIVLIIGGLGSVGGCFVAALLVGLTDNYIAFIAPKLALGSNILLMVLILMWRPRGLFPVAKQ
jgi:branched-chain amino acid transport system permease protein